MEDLGANLASLRIRVVGCFATFLAGICLFATPALADHPAAATAAAAHGAAAVPTGECVIDTLPTFIDQGLEGEASSVADVIEVECNPSEYDGKIQISDLELNNRCRGTLSWSPTNEFKPVAGPSIEATLDNDGGATVVLWGGPGCKPGESTIMVDQTEYPFETYMSTFTVLPPEPSPELITAMPAKKVEDDVFSSVATIIQVEFPVVETKVAINAEQLLSRCGKSPHVIWVGPDEKKITEGTGRLEGANALLTDDDGNAFVVALGAKSCQPGKVTIEASLEEAESFDSIFTTFEIEFPRVTVPQSSFKVEKEQKIGAGAYTKERLKGKLHEIVDYRIKVTNTGKVPITLTALTDPKCTNIVGPEKAELLPNEVTFYTCEHELTSLGAYINEAEVETSEHKTGKSNKVEVEVPREERWVVEKEQKIGGGSYTTEKLKGKLHEIVDYRIKVTNEGNFPLKVAKLIDPGCTNIKGPEQSELKEGESTFFTCEHELTSAGTYPNEAEVETTEHKREKSNKVEVEVPEFLVEKEQKIGAGSYTKERLTGQLHEIVDYKIIVKNTGTVTITLANIVDGNCTNIVAPAQLVLKEGESVFYTCEHELTSLGLYANEAEVEITTHKTEHSNKVEVEVPTPGGKEAFTVEKEQKVGVAPYTRSKQTGALEETVDYKIIVTNTGEVPITLAAISDPNCTNIVGPAKAKLGLGESTFYTCEHKLTQTGTYVNVAEVETTGHKTGKSNQVEVEVARFGPGPGPAPENKPGPGHEVKAVCTLNESKVVLRGASGVRRKAFSVKVPAFGIKFVTFFLDGHKLKRVTHSAHGFFSITINPRKLGYGGHRVTVAVEPSSSVCKALLRSGVFVHPRRKSVSPRFTG